MALSCPSQETIFFPFSGPLFHLIWNHIKPPGRIKEFLDDLRLYDVIKTASTSKDSDEKKFHIPKVKLFLREKKSLDREKFFFLQLEKSTLFHFLLKKKNRQQNKISLKENVSNKLFRSSSALKKMLAGRWRFIFGLFVFCFGNSVSRKSSEKPTKLGQFFCSW